MGKNLTGKIGFIVAILVIFGMDVQVGEIALPQRHEMAARSEIRFDRPHGPTLSTDEEPQRCLLARV